MPPPIAALAIPSSPAGDPAREWLESQGLMSRIPCIRSRDDDTINRDRFLYYLTRRLGLGSAFTSREALRLGSWFHTRLECLSRPAGAVAPFMQDRIKVRSEELRATAKLLDMTQEATLRILADEREDALTTWAWYEAAASFKPSTIPNLRNGFEAYFAHPNLRILGREVLLALHHEDFPKTLLVVELDILFYNEKENTLWIGDAKTHDGDPLDRVEFFSIDFQPRHYSFVVTELLKRGVLQKQFGLPANVRLGGFIHLVIQKPSIRMGQKDRPFILMSKGLKKKMKGRGVKSPNGRWNCVANDLDEPAWPTTTPFTAANEDDAIKWLQEACGKLPDREYSGEPSFELYKGRCIDWYNGDGEYASEKPLRESEHAPVNISTISAESMLDTYNLTEYLGKLKRIYHYATCPANPDNFDRTTYGMQDPYSRRPIAFSALFTAPIRAWPEIIKDKHLIPAFDGEDQRLPTLTSFVSNP